jgi:hypothetical protein
VQGIGAPFGIGLLASILYFARVRGEVERAQGLRDAVV